MPNLEKGTKILCPRKRHLVATLNAEILSNSVMSTKYMDFELGQERVAGEPSVCKICGSVYFLQGKLYTQDGWSPSDPELEPTTRR